MNKPIIHFAHANGFPAQTYNKLFSYLADRFEIGYIERHGHHPEYPVTPGWPYLKEELIAELESRYREPVIGVGHSLGGILHFLAAVDRPELFRAVILLDAPVISPLSSFGWKIIKKSRLTGRFSPARQTRLRRSVWEDAADALAHFSKKEKFRAFDKDVLRDYVRHGTVAADQGVRLYFRREVEAQIYQTLPDYMPKLIGRLKVPAAYIGGKRSREARLARLSFMQKHFPAKYYFLEGSHLFPLENPRKTADLINRAISATLSF